MTKTVTLRLGEDVYQEFREGGDGRTEAAVQSYRDSGSGEGERSAVHR